MIGVEVSEQLKSHRLQTTVVKQWQINYDTEHSLHSTGSSKFLLIAHHYVSFADLTLTTHSPLPYRLYINPAMPTRHSIFPTNFPRDIYSGVIQSLRTAVQMNKHTQLISSLDLAGFSRFSLY